MKRPRMGRPSGPPLAVLPRVFAVLAACLLVGSVALASLLPSDITLGQALQAIDESWLDRLQQAALGGKWHGLWSMVVVPVLVRPVWLLPVGLGLMCIGGAVTALSHTSQRTKQRRS